VGQNHKALPTRRFEAARHPPPSGPPRLGPSLGSLSQHARIAHAAAACSLTPRHLSPPGWCTARPGCSSSDGSDSGRWRCGPGPAQRTSALGPAFAASAQADRAGRPVPWCLRRLDGPRASPGRPAALTRARRAGKRGDGPVGLGGGPSYAGPGDSDGPALSPQPPSACPGEAARPRICPPSSWESPARPAFGPARTHAGGHILGQALALRHPARPRAWALNAGRPARGRGRPRDSVPRREWGRGSLAARRAGTAIGRGLPRHTAAARARSGSCAP
jgi:hypothetical protein